jgi:RNA polymerase sigma-70 factor (ECF subfamily)
MHNPSGHRDLSTAGGPQDGPEDARLTVTDAALLRQLRAGHAPSAAFEELFRRHYRRVYEVLYRLVGDDADDLAQEVFLRLYRRPPTADETDLAGWLYRVSTNVGYNALRSRRRLTRYRDLLGAVTGALGWRRTPPDPAAEAERRDEQARVRAALARLNERQAAILVLRYSGLSYREIGESLGVATGSVGTLLRRAEEAFRAAYEPAARGKEEEG